MQKLLYLQPGELKRLLPFFGFYLLLFTMLNIGDGVSLALFVHKVGAAELPIYYGVTALVNFLLVALYLKFTDKLSHRAMFQWILLGSVLMFFFAWLAIRFFGGSQAIYGLLFISREISFTMVLMHFGTFLQDFFTRKEMDRVVPLIYSAGRVGGILGGLALGLLSQPIGLMNMVLVYLGLGLLCSWFLAWSHRLPTVQEPQADQRAAEAAGPATIGAMLRSSSLLFWLSLTSGLFMVTRWVLNYEYNDFFETYFPSDVEMASFLGWFSTLALTVSLILQVFVINRLVGWIGTKGAHFVYSLLILLGLGLSLLPMTLNIALFCRLLETELRVGFRNPISMLISNKFPKPQRARARAWSMGVVVPAATLFSSFALQALQQFGLAAFIAPFGFSVSALYFLTSFGLYGAYPEKPSLPFLPAGEPKLAITPTSGNAQE